MRHLLQRVQVRRFKPLRRKRDRWEANGKREMYTEQNAETTLPQSIAKQHSTDNDAKNLSDYTLIEDDAAE